MVRFSSRGSISSLFQVKEKASLKDGEGNEIWPWSHANNLDGSFIDAERKHKKQIRDKG